MKDVNLIEIFPIKYGKNFVFHRTFKLLKILSGIIIYCFGRKTQFLNFKLFN